LRPEIAAARLFLGTLARDSLVQALSHCPDWSTLLRGSDPEGLTPLVAGVIGDTRGPFGSQANTLVKGQFLAQGRYQQFLIELAELLRACQVRGLLLKGAGLLQTVYRRYPGMRPLGDVDLFIPPQDFDRVDRVLRQAGYEVKQPMLYERGQHWVDLHLDLLNGHLLPSRALAFRMSGEDFLARGIALQGSLEGLYVPDPVDQFLHLSVHALKHSHGRLFWLVDLALVLRQCGWQELLDRARQTQSIRPLYYSLELLSEVFALEVPARARLNLLEKWYLRKVLARPRGNVWGEVITCLSVPGWWDRLVYLCELIRPRKRLVAYWRRLWPF